MPQKYTLSSSRGNTISNDGILRECFDTFSSKSGLTQTFINNYNQSCSINFPCCSFTGKEKDLETGYGYFGARYMDHELMTGWLSVDPMSDKYPSISPYAYCAWNPVRLLDPDGREIKFDPESEGIIAEFRKNTESAIISAQTMEQRNELQKALDELDVLNKSDQMYHIEYGKTGSSNRNGVTDYDIKNDRVRMIISYDGKDGDIAHELKHAYQFEIGEMSFDAQTGGGIKSLLYDITDEQAAYQRGAAYGIEMPKNLEWFERTPLGGGAFYYPFLNAGDVQFPNIPGNKSSRVDAEMIQGLPISKRTIYRYEGKTYNNKK